MPKQYRSLHDETVISAGAIAANHFVGYDANQASVQGQIVLGVSEYAAGAAGQPVPVHVIGTAIVVAGAALGAGQAVISDNQGRAIPANPLAIAAGAVAVTSAAANGANDVTGSESAEHIVGRVLPNSSAGAAGALVEILLLAH